MGRILRALAFTALGTFLGYTGRGCLEPSQTPDTPTTDTRGFIQRIWNEPYNFKADRMAFCNISYQDAQSNNTLGFRGPYLCVYGTNGQVQRYTIPPLSEDGYLRGDFKLFTPAELRKPLRPSRTLQGLGQPNEDGLQRILDR